jgi:hypothetical protein
MLHVPGAFIESRKAIGRVFQQGGTGSLSLHGTCFLVAPRLALTCHHVVHSKEGAALEGLMVRFEGRPVPIPARVHMDAGSGVDLTVLLLNEDVPHPPFRLAEDARSGSEFYSYGFPFEHDEAGLDIAGLLRAPSSTRDGDVRLQLRVEPHLIRPGLSGAPVYVLSSDGAGYAVGCITGTGSQAYPDTASCTPVSAMFEAIPKSRDLLMPERNGSGAIGQVSSDRSHVAIGSSDSIPDGIFANVPPLDEFPLGRDHLLADLRERLTNSSTTAKLSIYGLPGVGKTTVAAALAWDPVIRRHFTGGTLWARFGPGRSAHTVLSEWMQVFGLEELERPDEQAARLSVSLQQSAGGKPFLIVLDDVSNAEDVDPFLRRLSLPNWAIVVTTRDERIAIHVSRETHVRVPELADDVAFELLARASSEAAAANPSALRQLAKAVGNLPLALNAIGSALRENGADEKWLSTTLARLRNSRTRLGLPSRPYGYSADVPTTVAAAIEISVDSLPSRRLRTAFAQLAVFAPKPADFSSSAAVAVWRVDSKTAQEWLQDLCHRSLLERSGTDRFTMHQVLADIATARLRDRRQVAERHRAYHLRLQETDLARPDQLDWAQIELARAYAFAGARRFLDLDPRQGLVLTLMTFISVLIIGLMLWEGWPGRSGDPPTPPTPTERRGPRVADLMPEEIAEAVEAPPENVAISWPAIRLAFQREGIDTPLTLAAAIATARLETAGRFYPLREAFWDPAPDAWFETHYGYQTPSGRAMGNTEPGDGARYAGRGFIQLTGRAHYRQWGTRTGFPLEDEPDRALEPEVAASVLAAYFKDRGVSEAAENADWGEVRKRIAGSSRLGYQPTIDAIFKIAVRTMH